MLNFEFENPEDQELLDNVIRNFNDQINKGLEDLDKRLRDIVVVSKLEEVRENLDYLTISRFNLMITKDYVNSEMAFRRVSKTGKFEFSVRRKVMKMLSESFDIADKIISNSFRGAFKYQYSIDFMKNPEDFFNYIFFTAVEEAMFSGKGTL